jgi:hypothetical protein
MEGEENRVQTVGAVCLSEIRWRSSALSSPLSPAVTCECAHRYASLYFVTCVDNEDNELVTLETIHHFVEVLDRYFGNVRDRLCVWLPLLSIDLPANCRILSSGVRAGHHFQFPQGWFCCSGVRARYGDVVGPLPQAYYILDEVLIGGYLQEVNKREILRICATQDDMMEEPKDSGGAPGMIGVAMPR